MTTTRRARHAGKSPTESIHIETGLSPLMDQQLWASTHNLSTTLVASNQPKHVVIHSGCAELCTAWVGGLTESCIQSNRPRQCWNTYRGLTDHTMQGRRL